MSSLSKVKQSRAQWKQKASRRGDENRYLRKELRRVKAERDLYQQRIHQAERQLKLLNGVYGSGTIAAGRPVKVVE